MVGRSVLLVACDKLGVLLGGVDPVMMTDGLDDGDGIAMLQNSKLFELLQLLQRRGSKLGVLEQKRTSESIKPRMLQGCKALVISIIWDQ